MSEASRTGAHGAPLSPKFGPMLMGAFALYAVFFALMPSLARAFPFEFVFYGGDKPAVLMDPLVDRTINFYCAVIGGVMTGWFATLALLMREPRRAVWDAALLGAVLWLIVDSLGSILTGHSANAAINAGFFAVIAGGLLASRPSA